MLYYYVREKKNQPTKIYKRNRDRNNNGDQWKHIFLFFHIHSIFTIHYSVRIYNVFYIIFPILNRIEEIQIFLLL